MTHHDKARELVDRLRGLEVCYQYAGEAADLITAQAEENRRLREALQRIESASKFWSEYPEGKVAIRHAHESTRRLAHAALSRMVEDG